jgi:hypothetical protein
VLGLGVNNGTNRFHIHPGVAYAGMIASMITTLEKLYSAPVPIQLFFLVLFLAPAAWSFRASVVVLVFWSLALKALQKFRKWQYRPHDREAFERMRMEIAGSE